MPRTPPSPRRTAPPRRAPARRSPPPDASAVYAAEFTAAVRRLSASLHEAATLPALREAVAWQNRHGLTTGIDVLVRRGPEPVKRNTKSRQHQALIASYLQRYCAKNDTIGFFGPVGWSQFDDGRGIRVTHAAAEGILAARVTYLEGWAVRAIMAGHDTALRPWLVPRRMPFVGVDGTLLRVPLAPPVPLTPAEAAVLRACDGIRDARAVAAVVLADPLAGFGATDGSLRPDGAAGRQPPAGLAGRRGPAGHPGPSAPCGRSCHGLPTTASAGLPKRPLMS